MNINRAELLDMLVEDYKKRLEKHNLMCSSESMPHKENKAKLALIKIFQDNLK